MTASSKATLQAAFDELRHFLIESSALFINVATRCTKHTEIEKKKRNPKLIQYVSGESSVNVILCIYSRLLLLIFYFDDLY